MGEEDRPFFGGLNPPQQFTTNVMLVHLNLVVEAAATEADATASLMHFYLTIPLIDLTVGIISLCRMNMSSSIALKIRRCQERDRCCRLSYHWIDALFCNVCLVLAIV